jgi:hypothetical protein
MNPTSSTVCPVELVKFAVEILKVTPDLEIRAW